MLGISPAGAVTNGLELGKGRLSRYRRRVVGHTSGRRHFAENAEKRLPPPPHSPRRDPGFPKGLKKLRVREPKHGAGPHPGRTSLVHCAAYSLGPGQVELGRKVELLFSRQEKVYFTGYSS
jgi:hypothetical protein